MAASQITATQDLPVSFVAKDRKGNVGTVDGMPEWATDNTDVVAIAPAPDGMSATISAIGMLGVANVQVTADADMGTGKTPIIGTLAVTVVGGAATVVELVPGTPVEQP